MRRSWEETAKILYSEHSSCKKAMAAGRAIDNALNKNKPHFMLSNYLAYFTTEKVGDKLHKLFSK